MSMALPIEGLAPRKNSAPPLLELRGIGKEFPGVKALDDVSFAIWPGEVHMLLGENGAGKSSLMKVLCGAYSADSGEFNYKGESVAIASTADAQKLGVAVIFQEFSLVPHLDIAQNIFLGREPKGRVPGTIGRRRILADAQRVLDSRHRSLDRGPQAWRGATADGGNRQGDQPERAHPGHGRADGGALRPRD